MLLGLVGSGLALLNVLGLLLITPIVGFYMLKDWDSFRKYFSGLVPKDRRPAVNAFMEIVDKSLSGFVRGQLMVCTALAFYYAVALMLAGLDIAVPIGIVTGYLIFIPYLGWTIGFLLAMGVAAAQFSDVAPIIVVMAVYLFGMGFEGWFLTPKLLGEKVGLHPVAVMFALLCGGVLGGLGGVVLAIPVASVLSACLQLWVKSRKS